MPDHERDILVCRANIDRCLRHIMTGSAPPGWVYPVRFQGSALRDFEGALQGYQDWCAELQLLETRSSGCALS